MGLRNWGVAMKVCTVTPPPTPMDGGWVEEALQSEGVLLGPPGSDMML